MEKFKVTLQIKEKGTKNKIKIKSELTKEGVNNLVRSNVVEILDYPRKQLEKAFKEFKPTKDD